MEEDDQERKYHSLKDWLGNTAPGRLLLVATGFTVLYGAMALPNYYSKRNESEPRVEQVIDDKKPKIFIERDGVEYTCFPHVDGKEISDILGGK